MKAVEKLSVTVLVDNYTDVLLPSTGVVKRHPIASGGEFSKGFLAEHGLSLLIDADGEPFIMDFGLSHIALPYNMEVLGISPSSIREGMLSHGHFDHFGALKWFVENAGGIKLYAHKKVTLKNRFFRFPSGDVVRFPEPPLDGVSVEFVEEPTEVLGGKLIVSGTIPRVTDFERGLPGAFLKVDGNEVKDPIEDDMAVYAVVKGKGLVVISGCAHAGIVNTVKHGMEVTGERLYAVLGGFHLTGPNMEEVVPRTIEELRSLSPGLVAPMHCTGWSSTVAIRDAFPDAFVLSTPGTRIEL